MRDPSTETRESGIAEPLFVQNSARWTGLVCDKLKYRAVWRVWPSSIASAFDCLVTKTAPAVTMLCAGHLVKVTCLARETVVSERTCSTHLLAHACDCGGSERSLGWSLAEVLCSFL